MPNPKQVRTHKGKLNVDRMITQKIKNCKDRIERYGLDKPSLRSDFNLKFFKKLKKMGYTDNKIEKIFKGTAKLTEDEIKIIKRAAAPLFQTVSRSHLSEFVKERRAKEKFVAKKRVQNLPPTFTLLEKRYRKLLAHEILETGEYIGPQSRDYKSDSKKLVSKKRIAERKREILRKYFLENKTKAQISKEVKGISKQRIEQIITKFELEFKRKYARQLNELQ